jgi:ABC-type transport system substrate-binding protein
MKKIHVYVLIGVLVAASGFMAVASFGVGQDTVVPFVVATASGPGKLDPLDAYDSESIDTIMQVVDGLYMYNYSSTEMESIPNLAEEMGTWSTDGSGDLTILTIPLKEGVTFHDGSIFNASAVKWNFDRLQYWTYGLDDDNNVSTPVIISPLGTASKTLFKQVGTPILNHTEIVDEYTVAFHLNLESVIWEKLLSFIACSIVLPDPDYEYGETFFNRIDINDDLIGTGPFILTDYVFDNEVVFDYNPNYHFEWGANHIERMIYLIVPDPVAQSLAVLNHEIHWGGVDADYAQQFEDDPALVRVPVKASVVYYMQMSLITMRDDYRYAASFIWNHTYYLGTVRRGTDYELHVPVPDGMQYHHEGFEGEPEYDYEKAQDIILNSVDPLIVANRSAAGGPGWGINATTTRAEWRAIAESQFPLATFNYTRYASGTITTVGTLMQDYLKDIGCKLVIGDAMQWDDWVTGYLENPAGHARLMFSFGGWGPDYNDPINMIEPLYGTGASSNCFGLANSTWNDKLLATYSATELTTPTRQQLFYDIQEDFVKYQIPSFYLLQRGGFLSFNRDFVDEDSIDGLKNVFANLYWFDISFTPPEKPAIPGFEVFTLIGVALGVTVFLVVYMRKRK